MNWSLLPLMATMTVRAGSHARGSAGFPSFPEWLGKNSSRGKKKRLVAELAMHLGERVSGGVEAVRLSYATALRDALLAPLLSDAAVSAGVDGDAPSGVDATIAMLDE